MDNQESQTPDKSTTPILPTEVEAMLRQKMANSPATKPSERPLKDAISERLVKLYAASSEEEFQRQEAEELNRRKATLVTQLAYQVGARYRPTVANLDGFQTRHKGQKEAVDSLKKKSRELGLMTAQGRGFVFFGPVGTGKDHLAMAMMYLAAGVHGIQCEWVNCMEVFGSFRDSMDTKTRESELLARYCEPTIICLSDPAPPVGDSSKWDSNVLYRLVDRRYHALKPTWATINIAKVDDGNEKLTAPIFDRLRHGAEMVPCFWPSYRAEHKRPLV